MYRVVMLLLMAMAYCVTYGAAPKTKVIGIVRDTISGERLSHISIKNGAGKTLGTTDKNGVFRLNRSGMDRLEIGGIGYDVKSFRYPYGSDTLRVWLHPSVTDLTEVVIKPKKQKYSKRNNPAVELMRRVREMKEMHSAENIPGYNYEYYDKMVLGLNDVPGIEAVKGVPVSSRKKLVNLFDTAIWTGKRVLDLTVKEKTGVRINDEKGHRREIVTGLKGEGIDQSFDNNYTRIFLEDALRDIDVYDNDMKMLRNSFVSPLSRIGADFYKYSIEDTVMIGTDRCVELSFVPHSPESTGFNGKLYIPVEDSVKYVRRLMFRLPKSSNVNYIKDLVISENYAKDSTGKVHKTLSDMVLDLQLMPGTPHFYVSRQSRRVNFGYDGREEYSGFLEQIGDKFEIDEASGQDDDFWDARRLVPLSYAERNLYSKESPFKNDKLFYWLEKIVMIVVRGYIPTGKESKFDIGPLDAMFSYAKINGFRLQLGGMTTAKLNPHIFARGYVAYGFGDHRWKYGGEVEYSVEKKKHHAMEFPRNSIKVSYSDDVDMIGQKHLWDGNASLLGSWTRMDNDMAVYRRHATVEYNKEWRNNLSLHFGFEYEHLRPSEWVGFNTGDGQALRSISRGAFQARLRFAPGEKFVQTNDERLRVNRDAWVFVFNQDYAPKGLFGGRHNYVGTELGVDKQFWFSSFGYLFARVRAGKVWTQVDFPDLCWQTSNITYTLQSGTFSLLNPMEFAMDQYASWDLTYHMNGLLLNRIPLVKKLKLREVLTFKGFVGHLTRKNNPEYNKDLLMFPDSRTSAIGKTPYMEASVGIENILTFLRVDYVWRLTYRHRPDISHGGVRVTVAFNF